ncbi:MAG: hypothetical protein H5T24_07060 [Bacteroidales bacterium]|nr:hypothetical protein [Bacteroidales bacterium]
MGTPWVELPRDTIRHACSETHMVSLTKTHRHIPPPTHFRVRLLCLCLLLPLHSLSGIRAGVMSYPTNNEQLIRIVSFVTLSATKDLFNSVQCTVCSLKGKWREVFGF